MRRFSVSVEDADYEKLKVLAEDHDPPLTLQYVIRFAVRRLLEAAEDPQLNLRLGDPTDR